MLKQEVKISAFNYKLPSRFEKIEISSIYNKNMTSGILELSKKNEYYPTRSDEKIMRNDVIESIVGIM
jgi:hypothetical protein